MKKIILAVIFILASISSVYGQTNTYTFTITWQDNANNEEGQIIYRDGSQIAKVGPDVTSYKDTVTGTVGNPVCYEISAYNAAGESSKSAKTATSCMLMPAPKATVPATPTGVTTAAITSWGIRVSWADNATDEIGYEISRRSWKPPDATVISAAADQTTYDDINLKRFTTYCYKVAAKGNSGYSADSNESCATTNK